MVKNTGWRDRKATKISWARARGWDNASKTRIFDAGAVLALLRLFEEQAKGDECVYARRKLVPVPPPFSSIYHPCVPPPSRLRFALMYLCISTGSGARQPPDAPKSHERVVCDKSGSQSKNEIQFSHGFVRTLRSGGKKRRKRLG